MTDPSGNVYRYAYDLSGNLKTVTYPDDTPADLTNNPKKTYIYGSDTGELTNTATVSQPHALTGIIDENGVRFATYKYDANGKAISTEHAGSVEKYSLSYAADGSYTDVTDPLNSVRRTHFTTILGVVKPTGSSQPAGSGCAAASSAVTYDANGNVASKTDFNAHKTCYSYDLNRNLETARVEGLLSMADCATNLATASLPANTRKISQQWHPDYRLATQTAEPKRRVIDVYNGQPDPLNGNAIANCAAGAPLVDGKPIAVLCKHSEQATTDATGALGFAATATGLPRTTTYTYNGFGQVVTENGPRTDVNDTVTTTYYPITDATIGNRGNIKDITNAIGQKTTYNSYDGNGRPLQITTPNGVVTTLTYTPRGWLKVLTTRDAANTSTRVATTSYSYDNTGLLKTVTPPDTSVLTYGYDAAHRLTSITDSLGNKVTYTLDNIGNRVAEKAIDPGNVLRRNITRVYDALNRLQSVTGALQ